MRTVTVVSNDALCTTNSTYKLFPVQDMQPDIHRMLATKDLPASDDSVVFRGNAAKYLG